MHASETHIYSWWCGGIPAKAGILQNPISVLHTALADLSGGKSVGTPTEPPGAEFAGQPYGQCDGVAVICVVMCSEPGSGIAV